MSVKKLVTLATAGIASVGVTSAALAGGSDYVPAPSYAGIYVEGNSGYTYRPWLKDASTIVGFAKQTAVLGNASRGNGGFTFGGDLGYQFNQYFAIESGWYYLPKLKFTTDVKISPLVAGTYDVKSGIAYGAFKGMAPIYANTYVFGKLGVAYTYNRSSAALPTLKAPFNVASRSNFWNPLFSAGVQYHFTSNWSVNAQYTFVPGYRGASSNRFSTVPATNLFTVGLGYKFLM
ncbi:outer membrane protein [Coxiella endosymbiont of Amblyomma nuttalli]|uniref:outer membrane protein n=1 Tax=Coxiella endosymbiont of Amblyomma nuttalli TaxID=2749996 RepID=UPI001BAB6D25|nr:outer membrane beta-barrel protein [Coxiella endosymbiont of Amblyomma nuttalli]QTS83837.1 outer membrane protein A [Coxiella endosymbiont of Amblyomma nuttalli]